MGLSNYIVYHFYHTEYGGDGYINAMLPFLAALAAGTLICMFIQRERLAVTLLVGVAEETMFRRILFIRLLGLFREQGFKKALLISAVCFSLLHAVNVLLFGIFMYLLYRRSKDRNLLPFFIAHAIGDIFGLGILSYFWM